MREQAEVISRIKQIAKPLETAADLDPLLEAIGDSRIVMLGEASHGTAEYYTWRAEITKRLILEKGFTVIAVEGDWPSCFEVNRWIKGMSNASGEISAEEVLTRSFERWPAWMWANTDIAELAEWLKEYNGKGGDGAGAAGKVGFYGMDVYSLWESLDEIRSYLEEKGDPKALETAERAFRCFQPYNKDEQSYAVSAGLFNDTCENEVVELLSRIRKRAAEADPGADTDEAELSAQLNAMVAVHAEHYYRTMVRGDAESWNVRDRHMVKALEAIMTYHGEGAKAVIWEHNTHIGDARATDMEEDGMVNVGQLLREQQEGVYAVGFSTYQGTVIAGSSWGARAETMDVPAAWKNSWDELLHKAGEENKLLIFGGEANGDGLFEETRGQRAIGVVYHPGSEWGNYVPTSLSKRYDALLYLDESRALTPLAARKPVTV